MNEMYKIFIKKGGNFTNTVKKCMYDKICKNM